MGILAAAVAVAAGKVSNASRPLLLYILVPCIYDGGQGKRKRASDLGR